MNKKNQHLQSLLQKYRDNLCTREDYEELIRLAQISENSSIIREVMQKDWEMNYPDHIKEREDNISSIPSPQGKLNTYINKLVRIAAAVAILATLGYLLYQWNTPDPILYTTDNGEVKEITLPDGSVVNLNANSQLTWIPMINPENDRLVKLTGEAFFKVTKQNSTVPDKDRNRGFRVQTPLMTIHVTGTAFNVSARTEDTEVYLQEGSVELEMEMEIENDQLHKMAPGEKVVLNNKTGDLTTDKSENAANSTSWMNGVLNYHNQSMEDVLHSLSELFGVEISCEYPALKHRKINLGVPYLDWENTKRALEMAIQVKFSKRGDHYIVIPVNQLQSEK